MPCDLPQTGIGTTPVQVDLWVIDLAAVRPEPAVASADERERAARLADEPRRRRYLARVSARRAILARYVGVDPRDLEFNRRCRRCGDPDHGRPRLAGVMPAPSFSCSSSDAIGLLAVSSDTIVGVDVERVRGDLDPSVLLAAGLTAPSSGEPAADRLAAYRTWVEHEAVLKGIGAGLAGTLTAAEQQELRRWRRVQLDPTPGYVGCVASPDPIKLAVHHWRGQSRGIAI